MFFAFGHWAGVLPSIFLNTAKNIKRIPIPRVKK